MEEDEEEDEEEALLSRCVAKEEEEEDDEEEGGLVCGSCGPGRRCRCIAAPEGGPGPPPRGRGVPRRTPPGPEGAGRLSGRWYPIRMGWTSPSPRPSRTGPRRPSAPPRRRRGWPNSPWSWHCCMGTVMLSRIACLPAPLLAAPRPYHPLPPPPAAPGPRSRLVRARSPTQGHHPLGWYVSKMRGGGGAGHSRCHFSPCHLLARALSEPPPCPGPRPPPPVRPGPSPRGPDDPPASHAPLDPPPQAGIFPF